MYGATIGTTRYAFPDLKCLLAKATPARGGDAFAGIAAASEEKRVAAQLALADLPLGRFLSEPVIPCETDEVTRLIVDTHDTAASAPIARRMSGVGLKDDSGRLLIGER
jgi:ethanolamine ammonia-lyase large subunit